MDIGKRLNDLADPTRGRLLFALEGRELSVAELQDALLLPQSTVSRHLKVLGRGDWVTARAEGASHRYRFDRKDLSPESRRLWDVVRPELALATEAEGDLDRVREVLARRHERSRSFFASEAGRWDRIRAERFGSRYELQAMLGLLEPHWVVGDLGCGNGHLARAMSPFVAGVVAVDESSAMLETARARSATRPNIDYRLGQLEHLPVADAECHVTVLSLVLPYVPEPGRVLAEAARAVRPGGRMLLIDLEPHDRTDYAEELGHLWQGFAPNQLAGWCQEAGLESLRVIPMVSDPGTRAPGLFVASARKPE